MMRWIVGSSMRARGVVAALGAALIVFGVWQIRYTRIDSLPEFLPPTVEIQTEALGLSAPEVEQLITVPLEQDLLAGVPWLDTMRSESIPGLSSIELVFVAGTDLLRARQVVQERLTQAAGLPNVSAPPQMLQPVSSTSRILMIRLSSEAVSPIEMSVEARWTIRPKLLGVPGVANVSIFGQRERQLQVQVDPDRLRDHGLSLDQVIETTGNALWASPLTFLEASTPGTGGFIDTANQRLGIQHLQPITTAADLARVPIDTGGGRSVRLGEVSDVVEDHQPLIGDAVFTDGRPGILLVVEKFPGANTLEVTRDVEAAVDALRQGLTGIDVDTRIYRPATFIERGVSNLSIRLAIGALLLALVLALVLFEWRSVVVVAASTLASILAAWLVLHLRGTTINTMVLAGFVMALVPVIDDAVIGTEAVGRQLRRRRMNGIEPPPAAGIVLETTLELRGAIVFATLVSLISVAPLLFLQGEAAPFAPPIVLTYGLAVVTSMIVALVVTPALGLLLLPGARLPRLGSPVTRWLQLGHDRALAEAIRAPRRTYLVAAAVVLAGSLAVPFLRLVPVPSFRDGSVLIDLKGAPGTSLPEMDRMTARMGRELSSLPGILDVGGHVGRAITSDQVVDVDTGQLWVSLDPSADYDATVRAIRGVVGGYPGIGHVVRTYSDERIGSVLSRTDQPIRVRLYGQDLSVLSSKAHAVLDAIAGIDGVVHPTLELQSVEPTIDVRVDLTAADRFGIVPGDVRRAAATFLSGIGVGSLYEQQKVFDVVVWGTPDTRASLDSVRGVLIDTPQGGHVRLGDVARVRMVSTPTVIRHQDLSRTIDVMADVQGRDVGSVAADVRSRIRDVRFPLEYHAELVGDYAERRSAYVRALEVGVAAAIGILLFLQAALGSWRLAAMLFLTQPLALAGGALAALVGNRVLSLGSVAGLLAVLAMSTRVGVVLIRTFQDLERTEGPEPSPALVLRGARLRLAPVATTVLAAGLALVPLTLSGVAAGQEIVQPMALVILGGLLTSILSNLFVVPVLYLRLRRPSVPETTPSEAVVVIPDVDQVAGS